MSPRRAGAENRGSLGLPRYRLFLEWLGVLLASLLLAWWPGSNAVTWRIDLQLLDFASSRSTPPASTDILIVTIDDASLAREGRWPWDRAETAALIDRLDQGGARLIVLDVLFPEASNPESDAALAASLGRAGKVVLPYSLVAANDQVEGENALLPIEPLRRTAIELGHAGFAIDPDGVLRRLAPTGDPAGAKEQLAAVAYRALRGDPPPALGRADRSGAAPVIPMRRPGAYRSISASSVLAGEVPAAFIRNRIVLVGATAAGLGDRYAVTAGGGTIMPGVEIHANLLDDFLADRMIWPAAPPAERLLGALVLGALFLGFWRFLPVPAFLLAIGLSVALVGGVVILALLEGIWIAPGRILLAIMIAYPLWGWRRLAAVSRFLEGEARRLAARGAGRPPRPGEGFDAVARQVDLLHGLVEAIEERHDFISRVIDATPDAICVFDRDDRLLLMNGLARDLFGDASSGLALKDLVAGVRGTLSGDPLELSLQDGRCFTVARAQIASELPGYPGSIVAFGDISAIRQAETERRHMLEFLSHDMRAPQAAILALLRGGAELGDGRIDRVKDHALRTLKLADDFVRLARLAEAPLDIEAVEVAILVGEAADRAWHAARENQVEIVQELPDRPLFMCVDAHVVSRVLDNLVGNAIRCGAKGGKVELRAWLEPGADRGTVGISVRDHGDGLPPERRTDPFARFAGKGGAGRTGVGLGLAFVKAAIDKHRAEIEVSSDPETGTCFTLRFPACPEE